MLLLQMISSSAVGVSVALLKSQIISFYAVKMKS